MRRDIHEQQLHRADAEDVANLRLDLALRKRGDDEIKPRAPAKRVTRRHPPLPWPLHSDRSQRAVAGGDDHAISAEGKYRSRWAVANCRSHVDQFELAGENAGPWIERAEFVVDRCGRIAPLN